MRVQLLVAAIAAIPFSNAVEAQFYAGDWSIHPVSYWCSNASFDIDRLQIHSGGPGTVQVQLQPNFHAPPLVGPAGPNGFIATATDSGFCSATYTLTLTFSNAYTCSGTLDVDFSPAWLCADCHDQQWSIVGQRIVHATHAVIGTGCAGSLGITHLIPQSWPMLGTTFQVRLDNLPLGVAFLVHGFSNTASSIGPLPAPLDGFGMPGCTAYTSIDATEFLAGTANAASWSLQIPNALPLLGTSWYQQALVPDPGFNALGAVASQARVLVIGNV